MKTTVEISDALFEHAKNEAARRGTTLRALIEQGLLATLKDEAEATAHVPRDGRVRGNGLAPAARAAGWQSVLDQANQR